MNKRTVGNEYEDMAVAYLEKQGFRVTERNFRVRQGEIDVIGYHNGSLVFVEVKYRKNDRMGLPEAAVGIRKQEQICKIGGFYRAFWQIPQERQSRYDVVAICGNEIRWYQNAFEHLENKLY